MSSGSRAPERWAPLVAVILFGLAYAALGRGFKAGGLLVAAIIVAAVALLGLPVVPETSRRERVLRWLPAIVPLSLSLLIDVQPRFVEVLFPDPDRRWAIGFAALVIGLLAGLLILLGVDVRRHIERAVHVVTGALGWIVSQLIYVVILLPLGIAHLWRRSDPLRSGHTAEGSAWHPAVPQRAHLATRTYRHERPPSTGRRSPFATATRVIGTIGLLLLADFAIGAAWERVSPTPTAPRLATATGGIAISTSAIDVEPLALDAPDAKVYPKDPREDLPAMAKYPWRHEYFQELQRAPTAYWPYLLWRPLPTTGRYVNITGTWERRSYTSPGSSGPEVPDVDFYGGSTTYGEGQRDQHTIASEVVRLAEADGLPIRAHNRGVRGWVNWQEMLLFEQLSADPASKPDLALFYDGANEADAQSHSIRGVPAHTVLDEIAVRMSGEASVATPGQVAPTPEEVGAWGHLQLLARDYRETSATARAGRWLRELVTGQPAGASPAAPATPAAPAQEDPEAVAPDLASVSPIYQRGQALIQDIAERRDVDVLFFWQPLQQGGWDGYREGLEAPTIDLSRAFIGHDDIFIDGTHHNEDGSVIAAEAIWEHLKPRVQAWYDEN